MNTHGDMNARFYIFIAKALGRGRVASPKLYRLYPEKAPVFILQEAEWIPGPI